MEERKTEETGGISLRNILYAIKNNLIMIILVIVLSAGCGLGVSFLVTPYYTASESVIYIAENEDEHKGGSTTTYINIMRAYFDTVVDFCQTGVVVDRANFYYVNYVNQRSKEPQLNIETYVSRVKTIEDPYSINQETTRTKEIIKANVSTNVEINKEDSDQFAFTINYVDENKQEAVDKLKCIILAFDLEIKSSGIDGQSKYFSGIKNNIISLGSNRVSSSVSPAKYVLVGGLIGMVLALGAMYLTSVLDNTIKDRSTLEELTGVNVLTVLEREGGNE